MVPGLVQLERIRGQLLSPFFLPRSTTQSRTDTHFFVSRLQIPPHPPRRKRPLHLRHPPPLLHHLLLLKIPPSPRQTPRTSPRPHRLPSNHLRQARSEDGHPQSQERDSHPPFGHWIESDGTLQPRRRLERTQVDQGQGKQGVLATIGESPAFVLAFEPRR